MMNTLVWCFPTKFRIKGDNRRENSAYTQASRWSETTGTVAQVGCAQVTQAFGSLPQYPMDMWPNGGL